MIRERRDRGAWALLAALAVLLGLVLALEGCAASPPPDPHYQRAMLAQSAVQRTSAVVRFKLAQREDGAELLSAISAVERLVGQALANYRETGYPLRPESMDAVLQEARTQAELYLAVRDDLSDLERELWRGEISAIETLVRGIWGQP